MKIDTSIPLSQQRKAQVKAITIDWSIVMFTNRFLFTWAKEYMRLVLTDLGEDHKCIISTSPVLSAIFDFVSSNSQPEREWKADWFFCFLKWFTGGIFNGSCVYQHQYCVIILISSSEILLISLLSFFFPRSIKKWQIQDKRHCLEFLSMLKVLVMFLFHCKQFGYI